MTNESLVKNETSIKAYFEEDHDRLDELFKNFQKFKLLDYPKAKEYFKEFKHGLQRHIIWEEDILFPVFEKKSNIPNGPTHVMRMEHRQIKESLEAIHDKVKKQDPNSNDDEEKLLSILKSHNMKEEGILYPAIDSLIDETEKKSIFLSMRNIPQERFEKCCG